MSKSKRNVVDPESIIESYGADTARWFMLSDSPPERDIEWTEAGAEGAWKFTQRLWRILGDAGSREAGPYTGKFGEVALELRRTAHRTLAAVTDDLSSLRFNRAIARIYELSNALSTALANVNPAPDLNYAIRESSDFLILMFAPMMPHLAEECWQSLGHRQPVVETPWPTPIPDLIVDDEVTVAVQVNGKRRDEIRLQKGLARDLVEAAVMKLEGVKRALDGKPVVKFIVVPDRIVNIVVSG
jgi:leucyl-tRNA synthetase